MFPERLKSLRKRKKLTHKQVADYLGVSRQAYAKYENGLSEPDIDTLNKLARLFDVSIDDLIREDDVKLDPKTFAERLATGLKAHNLSIDDAAQHCGVTSEYIQKLLEQPKIPGTGTLYKLAELIKVTPSYLCGLVDNPKEHSIYVPKPKEIIDFLEQNEVMLMGKILTEKDKEKLQNVMLAIFFDAKEMNKRSR